MDEVFKYQESITDSMRRENDKFTEIESKHDLDREIAQAKDYCEKLVNLKKSLIMIRERATKLRRRANKILENKNREDIERQRSKERRDMLEKHLEPVVNTRRV